MDTAKKKFRFNIVDVIVLLIIVALVVAVVHIFFGNKANEAVAKKVDCVAEVTIYGLEPEIQAEIERQDLVGEHTVSGTLYTDAVIEGVRFKPNRKNPLLNDVIFTIRMPVPENTTGVTNQNQELRISKDYIVKTRTFEKTGTVSYIQIGDEGK